MPHLALVESEAERRAMLAWVTTYLEAYSPFTAFCRVLTQEEFVEDYGQMVDRRLLAASIALVIMDARSQTNAPCTTRECAATFSFIAARSIALDRSGKTVRKAFENYLRLFGLLRDEVRLASQRRYAAAWNVLAALASGESSYGTDLPRPVFTACTHLWQAGVVESDALQELSPSLRGLDADVARMPGMTIEDRVTLFSRVAEQLRNNLSDVGTLLLLGYLLSHVSGGTLAHYRLGQRLSGDVLPWYALCSGLHREASFAATGDGAVALRVAREIERPFDMRARPTCDLAVPELEVMMDVHAFRPRGALRGLKSILVEVMPGIEAIALLSHSDDSPREVQQLELWRDESDDLARMQYHLEEALVISRKLGGESARGRRKKR
ncbi:hypothetical protein [Polyangium spumosum]|uniref:Uncharacterized protein n=1 Tax=Polyangium spumosum TaxID=889282 RepID=A0A6N7Q4A6_9BACT|nr:hypothetical protein [Polyangium spumosum]MRG98577.1 hypothetical protein [Polyangium spumosum]